MRTPTFLRVRAIDFRLNCALLIDGRHESPEVQVMRRGAMISHGDSRACRCGRLVRRSLARRLQRSAAEGAGGARDSRRGGARSSIVLEAVVLRVARL